MAEIGHNGYSFDDVVAENLERGIYWAQRDSLIRVIRDPNMTARHEIVLAELIVMTNSDSGVCYPGRRYLSEVTGYTEGTIATTIKELVAAGYIVSTRKAPEPGGRALAHYAVVKPTLDELRAAVDMHIASIRANATRSTEPSKKWSNVKSVIHLRSSEVKPVVHVNETDVKPVVHVNELIPDLCSKAEVNPVVPTVTSLNNNTKNLIGGEKAASRETRATRLPDDWELPRDWGRWATDNFAVRPSEVRKQEPLFRDYWIGLGGDRGRKANWEATWRNWCRRAFDGKQIEKPGHDAPLLDQAARAAVEAETARRRKRDEEQLAAEGWEIARGDP